MQLPDDLSPWGMFLNADIVVKIVMIGLIIASIVTWTVWLAKTIELRHARGEVRRDLRILNESATIAQAHEQLRDGNSAVALLMQSAAQEIRLSASLRAEGLKERIALQLERIEMAISRKISRGTGILATIGSTAPFVGLFGTVWGIMNSFIGISNAHTTNLAVVAPESRRRCSPPPSVLSPRSQLSWSITCWRARPSITALSSATRRRK